MLEKYQGILEMMQPDGKMKEAANWGGLTLVVRGEGQPSAPSGAL
jgi:hypothetical protein